MSDRTTQRPSAPRRPRQKTPADASPWKGLQEKWRRLLDSPQLDYKVIILVTGILVALGLMISLSASMVTSRGTDGSGSVFSQFLRQAVIVLVGLAVMWGALRIRPAKLRAWAPGFLFVAVALLLLVLVIGVGDDIGSRSWIALGPLSFQPSEIAKLALSVWGAAAVSLHTRRNPDIRNGLGPFILVSFGILALVLLQRDLGMMFSLALVVLALLLFSGVATRAFGVAVGIITVVGALAITAMSYRSDRISTWFNAVRLNFDDEAGQAAAYQARQGLYSLSDGGFLGVGPGQSRAKWNYLPEATNDFVFAIIGEELGILGAAAVIILFTILGWFGIRTATKQTDPFLRLLSATLTAGVVGQAFYNIGYVCGLLPVTGVQLPLISAGGTSAVITLATLGLLANCARHEPETVSSMQHEGRPWVDRVLLLPEPATHTSGAEHRDRVRPQARRYGEPVTHRSASRSGDLGDRRDTRHRSDRTGYRDTPERVDRTRSRQQRQYRTDEPRRRHRP